MAAQNQGNASRAAVAVVIIAAGVFGATRTSLVTPENKDAAQTVTATPSHEPRTYPVPGKPIASAAMMNMPHGDMPHGDMPHGDMDGPSPDDAPPELLAWTKPEPWQEVPSPSPMRKLTWRVPAPKGGDDAELAVSQAGGDLESNIQRWIGQFKDAGAPKRSEKNVGDYKVTIVEVEGTYAGMAPQGGGASEPKSGYALLAAIVETPGEPYFFKLTGPKKTVDAARPDFDKLVASFRKP